MNVVRLEKNTLASTRGRGRGRGRNRLEPIISCKQPPSALPKYEFRGQRWPLVNLEASTSTTISRTPRNPRRGNATSSSSVRNSAFRRYGLNTSTSGPLSTSTTLNEPDTCNILAITTGRGDARGEVGMAVIDILHPHMVLCQISDSNTYVNTLSKIYAMQPIEIIMPDTMCEPSLNPNSLYCSIKNKFDTISITQVARMHFHDSAGLDRIRTHCAEEFANVELYVKQKYYALAAAAALMKYVEYIQHIVYAPKSIRIDFQGSQNSTMIDIESAQKLELVTAQGGTSKSTLLGSLDRCSTPMGRRLLRVSILQPPCDLTLIQNRQASVSEFVSNCSLNSIVQPVVKRLYGTSRLLTLAMLTSQADSVLAAEKNLNYILLLKNIIDVIPELDAVLGGAESPFFKKVSQNLKDPRYALIKEKILSIIHPEARSVMGYTSSKMQRCFAIRSGISDLLDIARQAYCELIDDMQKIVEKLATKYNLPLSLGCNQKLGYHIEMNVPRRGNLSKGDFPPELIEVHQEKGTIFMTTEYLMVLSQHCEEACQELHLMSNVLLNNTLTSIREHIGCLLKLSDDVAELDIVCSLAQVSAIPDFVKPSFGSKLELRNSRHPVMDIWGVDSSRVPVPNDIFASAFHNFHTITGPNMSGKSVYLKQIVLLQIMAQIGCYVPASEAQFRITDRIFCRMCSRDDVECNSSTFVLEIKELQYILQSITPASLVILDELCRSTTVEEGSSIAWAICEKLICNSQAFVFNATHFLFLTRLAELYYNVTNHYFETESNVIAASGSESGATRLIYTHKLKKGVVNVWNYGIALAKSTGLPREIITVAEEYAAEIAKTVKPPQVEIEQTDRASKVLYYNFVAELAELLEKQQLTVENVSKVAREMNIPDLNIGNEVDTEDTSGKMEMEMEMETSDPSPRHFAKPKPLAMPVQFKRQPSVGSISLNTERKKQRKSDVSPFFRETPDKARDLKLPEKRTDLKNSIKNVPPLTHSISSSPVTVSSDSSNDRQSRRTSFDHMQQRFTSPNSITSDDGRWKYAVEEPTNHSTQMSCYSKVSASTSKCSQESITTPVARRMVRDKEADIFRIIEGSKFDEESFLNSFMNPTINLEDSDDD